MKNIKIILATLVFVIIGFVGGYFGKEINTNKNPSQKIPNSGAETPLINPTVLSGLEKHFIINFLPLRKDFLDIQKKYPPTTYIYFNYVNNASWIGIGERDFFAAASTIKVPLAMTIYKMEEEGKLKMTDSYSLDEIDLNEDFGDLYKVGANKEFDIESLVKIMLEKSDNTAAAALVAILRKIGVDDPFSDVYMAMGWDAYISMGAPADYNQMNVRTLSNMFLALYNATYINIENSNQILTYLSNSPFNDKIVAGIPGKITVAHKIGVAENKETFSDCGIIYVKNRNYILCLGTSGIEEKEAARFMAEISKSAYQYVINN